MSFDGIKMGRIPKEVKKQALQSKLLNQQESGNVGEELAERLAASERPVDAKASMRKESYAVETGEDVFGYFGSCNKKSNNSTSSGSISSRYFAFNRQLSVSLRDNFTVAPFPIGDLFIDNNN